MSTSLIVNTQVFYNITFVNSAATISYVRISVICRVSVLPVSISGVIAGSGRSICKFWLFDFRNIHTDSYQQC